MEKVIAELHEGDFVRALLVEVPVEDVDGLRERGIFMPELMYKIVPKHCVSDLDDEPVLQVSVEVALRNALEFNPGWDVRYMS